MIEILKKYRLTAIMATTMAIVFLTVLAIVAEAHDQMHAFSVLAALDLLAVWCYIKLNQR